jgi:hypothetical protein
MRYFIIWLGMGWEEFVVAFEVVDWMVTVTFVDDSSEGVVEVWVVVVDSQRCVSSPTLFPWLSSKLEGTIVSRAWVDTNSGVDIGMEQSIEDIELILVPCLVVMVAMVISGLQRKFVRFPH